MNINLGWQNFEQEVNQADDQINLAKASLFYARAEYSNLDVDKYISILDAMAEEISRRLPEERYPLKIMKAINNYLFTELGYRGNNQSYYDPRNSFLNNVIDRRTGIPITLSVIYLEIAKRIDFSMVGVGMPGHFLVRPTFQDSGIFVDAFNQGEIMFKQDCLNKLKKLYEKPIKLEKSFFAPVNSRQILLRMLTNLKYIYLSNKQLSKSIDIISGILMLYPDNPKELRDRGLVYYQLDKPKQAFQDLECYLAILPNAEDAMVIRKLLEKKI
ncbi:MAG: transglutaminase-like domain-containing protein [Xenococcaceae cyanobacterium MO_188.B32]|nr:transglutaminase-like domain-containing protein [Xenococcaceae cyanobacterium MO_188.B32]